MITLLQQDKSKDETDEEVCEYCNGIGLVEHIIYDEKMRVIDRVMKKCDCKEYE